jgi:hypothetical protein
MRDVVVGDVCKRYFTFTNHSPQPYPFSLHVDTAPTTAAPGDGNNNNNNNGADSNYNDKNNNGSGVGGGFESNHGAHAAWSVTPLGRCNYAEKHVYGLLLLLCLLLSIPMFCNQALTPRGASRL